MLTKTHKEIALIIKTRLGETMAQINILLARIVKILFKIILTIPITSFTTYFTFILNIFKLI